LCYCNSTYGDLLFIQVCSEPAQIQCNTGLGQMHSPLFSSALKPYLQLHGFSSAHVEVSPLAADPENLPT